MGIARHIKEIGRGHEGARSLGVEAAEDLMGQILDGQCSDLEIGAFCLAMRIKGETGDELVGFLKALHARVASVPSDRPVVLIPSYNGARRLPNLTPLLALRLAQEGARVLVHGPLHDPARVTSAEIFTDMGLALAETPGCVAEAWSRHEPAFLCTNAISPALQRLLDVRWVVGLRNSGHTIAKMMNPVQGAPVLRLMSHTHPEFGALMAGYAEREAADMMLLRGTEGEPVADPRRLPKLDVWLHGQWRIELSCQAQDGSLSELPLLPRSHDATTTAMYIQAVASGEKPAPAPLDRQVQLLLNTLAAMDHPAPQERRA